MRFRKFHGIGNDFVMVEDLGRALGPAGMLDPGMIARVCDRHFGVGGDGLIRVIGADADFETAQAGAALRMDYYNADGSVAEMCGNGIRCVAVMGGQLGWIADGEHKIMSAVGAKAVKLNGNMVTVDMGEPELDAPKVPIAGFEGAALDVTIVDGTDAVVGSAVSMGNPHFIVFTDEITDAQVLGLGPRLEVNPAFPRKTNVEFVEVLSPDEVRMRVWERGVGETLACGTGACAVAVAAATLGRTKRRVAVHLPGGTLDIDWAEDGRVWMTGPAEESFTGEF